MGSSSDHVGYAPADPGFAAESTPLDSMEASKTIRIPSYFNLMHAPLIYRYAYPFGDDISRVRGNERGVDRGTGEQVGMLRV